MLTKRYSMSLFVYCLNILISGISASSYQALCLSPRLVFFYFSRAISLTLANRSLCLAIEIGAYSPTINRVRYLRICYLYRNICAQIKNTSCKRSLINSIISDPTVSRQVETEKRTRKSTEGAIKSRSPSTHTQQYATTAAMTSLS